MFAILQRKSAMAGVSGGGWGAVSKLSAAGEEPVSQAEIGQRATRSVQALPQLLRLLYQCRLRCEGPTVVSENVDAAPTACSTAHSDLSSTTRKLDSSQAPKHTLASFHTLHMTDKPPV